MECNQEKTRAARDRLQALATELNDADPEGLGIFIMVRKDHAESTCCNMDPPSMLEVLKEFISDDRRRNHLN